MRPLLSADALLAICLLVFAHGCSPYEPPGTRYDNTIWNVTSADIYNVRLSWEANGQKFEREARQVSPAVYHFIGMSMASNPEPIPDRVVVSWMTGDGKTHEQTVDVASRIPDMEHFRGSIFYRFDGRGVTVGPYTYEYQERNVKHGKPAVP